MLHQFPYSSIYFYHPDHLGTSTYLTDANGMPYQFFINLLFGETMAEQHSLTEDYETPYKFNGKELDTETGYYYYGARYYEPKASIWLSVDPLAEKYPGINPYVYCMQNPINLVDPTGMEPYDHIFYSHGNFIRDTGVGNEVKIMIRDKLCKLSDLDYTKKGTRLAVSKIICYYTGKMGASGYFGVITDSALGKNVGGYTKKNGTVLLNSEQFSNGKYNNLHDLISTIAHEGDPSFGHKSEKY